ncbi:MAG: hypothetical protein U0031_00650 [Thermomicrobiales bacterium]
MTGSQEDSAGPGPTNIRFLRPQMVTLPDRHILLGVSHASDNAARHRVFEVRARFDDALGGWVAQAEEQNMNGQPGPWEPGPNSVNPGLRFATAAACLGNAVTEIVAAFDADAAAT